MESKTEELTPQQKRQYVEERWERVHVCDGGYQYYARGTVLITYFAGKHHVFLNDSAAYDFTRQREEEIRMVEEEIVFLADTVASYNYTQSNPCQKDVVINDRIIAKLSAEIATLRRGMKEGK